MSPGPSLCPAVAPCPSSSDAAAGVVARRASHVSPDVPVPTGHQMVEVRGGIPTCLHVPYIPRPQCQW